MKLVQRKKLSTTPALSVRRTKSAGRGVFAEHSIAKGAVIEKCDYIAMDWNKKMEDKGHPLAGYVYQLDKKRAALALGKGSLYNHSFEPNAVFSLVRDKIVIKAKKDIDPGEQIFIDYGYSEKEFADFGIHK
jgi:uncharacterized protein